MTKSSSRPEDFFAYYPASDLHRQWGVYATSFGEVATKPGRSYPRGRHPGNHHLSWEKGRVLNGYQLVFITEGAGRFETASTPETVVKSGSVLMLFPGVWHRYRPDPATGWSEAWIEFQGPHVDGLRQLGILDPARPLFETKGLLEIPSLFAMAARLSQAKAPGFQVRLGFLALQVLSHLCWRVPGLPSPARKEQLIQEAQNLLALNLDQPMSAPSIARALRVGYTTFRRSFKEQTGFSPKRYRAEIRFRHICDFLRNTELSLKEVALRLGYDSPYHLSADFKARTGVPPGRWRRKVDGKQSRPGRPADPLPGSVRRLAREPGASTTSPARRARHP